KKIDNAVVLSSKALNDLMMNEGGRAWAAAGVAIITYFTLDKALRIISGGVKHLRKLFVNLEAAGLRRVWPGQQVPKGMGELTPHEKQFLKTAFGRHENLQFFRGGQKDKVGDFIVVDPSNPRNPLAIAVELKTSPNAPHAGTQLENALTVLNQAGFTKDKS